MRSTNECRRPPQAILFQVEQAYWRHLRAKERPLDAIPAAVGAEVGLDLSAHAPA